MFELLLPVQSGFCKFRGLRAVCGESPCVRLRSFHRPHNQRGDVAEDRLPRVDSISPRRLEGADRSPAILASGGRGRRIVVREKQVRDDRAALRGLLRAGPCRSFLARGGGCLRTSGGGKQGRGDTDGSGLAQTQVQST
eukprot:Rmarinus@m.29716